MDEKAKKAGLRAHYRAKRASLDKEFIAYNSQSICTRALEHIAKNHYNSIFCYVSMRGEVDTASLIKQLLSDGKRVFVPRCINKNGAMEPVLINSLDDLVTATYGIKEPRADIASSSWSELDFAVIPAIACSKNGTRLGQGGGYYDRFLNANDIPCVALCFEDFLCDDIPSESFDKKVDSIISEKGIYNCAEEDN